MMKEKVLYEVNGKLFESKEEAEKEELKSGVKYKEIAEKYHVILNKVSSVAQHVGDDELIQITIDVKDKEISPEWYVTKPYYNVFVRILKDLEVKYLASDGDERRSAYFRIHPTKIETVPTVDELAKRIPIILDEQEKAHQAYLDKLMGRK